LACRRSSASSRPCASGNADAGSRCPRVLCIRPE
jgi:hypothetical protein